MSSIPKLRVARQSSSQTGTGSTTIPIDNDLEREYDPEHEHEHEQDRATLATLSSETEHENPPPAHRLRSLMARMDSFPSFQESSRPGPMDRKAHSAPSVRDSDLDSIPDLPFEPTTSTSAAKTSLRDVFEKALVRPIGNTPTKVSRLIGSRGSVSDDDLSARPMSRAESLDQLKAELDDSMLRSALDHPPLSSNLPLHDFDSTLRSLHSADFQDMSTPPRNLTSTSQSEASPPATPKLTHAVSSSNRLHTPLTRSSHPLEPFSDLGDSEASSPQLRSHSPILPSTRPKFITSTRTNHASTSSTLDQGHKRPKSTSPDRLLSKMASPWSSAQRASQAHSKSLKRSDSSSGLEEDDKHSQPIGTRKDKHYSKPTAAQELHRIHSGDGSHTNDNIRGKHDEKEHEHHHELEKGWGRNHALTEQKLHAPPLHRNSSTSPNMHRPSTPHRTHSGEEEESEEMHEKERNWNSPKPHWTHHQHPSSHSQHHWDRKHRESEDGSGTEREHSNKDSPGGVAATDLGHPPASLTETHPKTPKTPRPPGSWATPASDGITMPDATSTPIQASTVAYSAPTPVPPGGYAASPSITGAQSAAQPKGILKVRWQQNHATNVEAADPPEIRDVSSIESATQEPTIAFPPHNTGEAPSIEVTPSTPSPRRKSQLRVVDAMGVEMNQSTSDSPFKSAVSSTSPDLLNPPNRTIVSRIKAGLEDIAGDLPAAPDQSNSSIVLDTTTNSEDERQQLRNHMTESRESRAMVGKKIEILHADELNLEDKLAKLRRSFLESEVIHSPLVVDKQGSPWRIANLVRRMFLLEIVCTLFIYWMFSYHSRTQFISIYYDPFYPALQAHPQGSFLAAHAAGYDDSIWSLSDLTSIEFWHKAVTSIWNYVGHIFWTWWTEGGWYGWSGTVRHRQHWVPT